MLYSFTDVLCCTVHTGLDLAMNFMLGKASTVFWAQVRMMIPVMVASAFLNNTPICALMIPILISWGRR